MLAVTGPAPECENLSGLFRRACLLSFCFERIYDCGNWNWLSAIPAQYTSVFFRFRLLIHLEPLLGTIV
jgi:hypothetical protein